VIDGVPGATAASSRNPARRDAALCLARRSGQWCRGLRHRRLRCRGRTGAARESLAGSARPRRRGGAGRSVDAWRAVLGTATRRPGDLRRPMTEIHTSRWSRPQSLYAVFTATLLCACQGAAPSSPGREPDEYLGCATDENWPLFEQTSDVVEDATAPV